MNMQNITQGLFDYIQKSPTSFHAVSAAAAALEQAGYRPLLESQRWDLHPGDRYYVTRNQSSLIAFRMPETVEGFMVGAAHTDSPCFRIKDNAAVTVEGYTKLDANKYGGMIYATWMDRPLSIAGRLLVRSEQGVDTRLVNLDQDLLVIPTLAIHMDRSINDGKTLSAQVDLMPLLGKGKVDFFSLAAEAAGVQKEDILSHDLFVYNHDRGTRVGAEGEFILCPRLDDLQCAYALLEGFLQMEAPKAVPVLCLFDSEEVGSQTRQGAMSTFLSDTLRRITGAAGLSEEDHLRLIAGSMMVSADNAHGVHPNHPEKAALTSRPKLGDGIVVKYGSGYCTSGVSAALFLDILEQAGIPYQSYFNHSDVTGGRTLGGLAVTQVPMHSVDIGLAQLAMHSACETAGTADTGYLIDAMKRFFAAKVTETHVGSFIVEG